MRTLVIGHDHVAGLGHLDLGPVTWFTVVGEDRFDDPDVAVSFPDPAAYDLVVTLGAPWPRERIAGWAADEVRFLDAARRGGAAVLGVCFGAQLVAEMLGGSTRPLPVPRLGWREVTPHDDRVAAGPWFSWHAAQLVPPPGATVLATDDDGVAAFRHGRCAGVQFHPEMTPELLDDWLTVPGAPAVGDLRAETAQKAADAAAAVPDLLRALLSGTIREDRTEFAAVDRKAARGVPIADL
ncbi:type 1 glutamine amidotransferase [Actinomycetospora atypica]|uniref:Type 1 glutamine amidotransferase n=1 Tax=Actinomycetospora atypica TaxID=1290095 RepID=A0ABV9YUV1_9PSEU